MMFASGHWCLTSRLWALVALAGGFHHGHVSSVLCGDPLSQPLNGWCGKLHSPDFHHIAVGLRHQGTCQLDGVGWRNRRVCRRVVSLAAGHRGFLLLGFIAASGRLFLRGRASDYPGKVPENSHRSAVLVTEFGNASGWFGHQRRSGHCSINFGYSSSIPLYICHLVLHSSIRLACAFGFAAFAIARGMILAGAYKAAPRPSSVHLNTYIWSSWRAGISCSLGSHSTARQLPEWR